MIPPLSYARSTFGLAQPDGLLLVDKPPRLTSHDVVDRIRRQFHFNKVGHAGTLDPQATGLLILMIGRATRLANTLLAGDKTYEGALRLGIATDTQDADGRIISESPYHHVTRAQVEAAIQKLTGDLLQTPPMVSAVKKNGVPLYKLARQGKTVERTPKLVHIYEFNLCDFAPPRVAFFLRCSKGCYVRTLCADLGTDLGCGAHLERLRRTQIGEFALAQAASLQDLLRLDRTELLEKIIPLTRLNLPPARAP
ncbi:MAG: tRNA pseudouridine(55) synthase TruB [Lentisphaerae bacterium]|nr:tRNA pseudouridine(55) synthase TruB [Lentisphaerota bacterium]